MVSFFLPGSYCCQSAPQNAIFSRALPSAGSPEEGNRALLGTGAGYVLVTSEIHHLGLARLHGTRIWSRKTRRLEMMKFRELSVAAVMLTAEMR